MRAGIGCRIAGHEPAEHYPKVRAPRRSPPAREAAPADQPATRGDQPAAPTYDPDHHIHAVPTNGELKASRAVDLFNGSEHPRTVAGVARSLGPPAVTVRPSDEASVVGIVVAWELCWYRYEVDLADEAAGVRQTGQGDELVELDPADQVPNAAADERGELQLVSG